MQINDNHILTLLKIYIGKLELTHEQEHELFKTLVSHLIHGVILNEHNDETKYLRSLRHYLRRTHEIANNTGYNHVNILKRCELLIQSIESNTTETPIT